MTERQKKLIALLIVTLALLLMGVIEAFAQGEFYSQVGREVDGALRGRDGIVIWLDRDRGKKKVFGNPRLSQEYFLPGSLMKLVTAESALQHGLHPQYRCEGQDRLRGKKLHCWTPKGHGPVDLPQALGRSCNLFFARLGNRLGTLSLIQALQVYPFAQGSGLRADSLDPLALAIGDTPGFQVTPTEITEFWNRYLNKLEGPSYAGIKQGLRRAITEGTAQPLGSSSLEILGKTGTADSQEKAYGTHGWFLGAYPTESPRYLLVILLKNAHGYEEPVRLAREIFKLAKKSHVIP